MNKGRPLVAQGLALFCGIAGLLAMPTNGPTGPLDTVDIVDIKKVGKPPMLISQVEPVYPFDMESARFEGEVLVKFVVDTNGRVREERAVQSNNQFFEKAALDAVRQWRFKPGLVKGNAVNVAMMAPIEFSEKFQNVNTSRETIKTLPPEYQWDKPPVPINTTLPVYPFEQLVAGQAETIPVIIAINKQGAVQQVIMGSFEGPVREYGLAVQAALELWRFTPARKGTEPCGALWKIVFRFTPKGRDGVPISDGAKRILDELKMKEPQISTTTELDGPLKPLSQQPPGYPLKQLARAVEGEAVIEFFIDQEGGAQMPRIVAATEKEFGYAAAQAVATWRFTPPMKKGIAVVARVRTPIKFSLDGKRK